jgi:glyoxylase-like metal-dependent hydrolase (beta-lactamase superfamily II)
MRVDRILAPNPGPYTGPGTNTYVISSGGLAVVLDPGPVIPQHVAGIEGALEGLEPLAVLVTHTHPDHAPAANPLGERLDVPVLGFAPGPEFEPTRTLADGDEIRIGEISMHAVHTPGHTDDHLCYRVADVVFTGDHIMGGSTVIIEDAAAYMRSLEKVLGLRPAHLYPGHGPELGDASAAITEYINHRIERERQVLSAIVAGASTVGDIVRVVYAEVDESLHPAAAFQVRTQLQKLASEGRVTLRRGDADEDQIIAAVAVEESE